MNVNIVFPSVILAVFLSLQLTQCSPQKEGRWYTPENVAQGKTVFQNNCAQCHGMNAEGNADWKTPLPDGSYPPPPLNGSAHAWHHSMSVIKRTIDYGGVPVGGTMPGFKDKLTDDEKNAAVAYFQSFWDDEKYRVWLDRGGLD